MSNTPNKPTLEDLLASKKLSNPTPQSWTKFDEEVKIKTLDSLHKQHSFNTPKKIILFFVILLLPVFLLQHIYFTDNDLVIVQASTTGPVKDSHVTLKNSLSELADDLTISEVEFADNIYDTSTSEDFELSYALENFETPEMSFVTTALDLEENRRTDLLSNFAF